MTGKGSAFPRAKKTSSTRQTSKSWGAACVQGLPILISRIGGCSPQASTVEMAGHAGFFHAFENPSHR
jgi:hypothetical protein